MTPEEAIDRLAAAKNNLERAEIITALIATVEERCRGEKWAEATIEPEGYILTDKDGYFIAGATTIDAIAQAAKERGLTIVNWLEIRPPGPPDPPRPKRDREWA